MPCIPSKKWARETRKHSAEGRKEVEDDEVEVILLDWLIDSYLGSNDY